MNLDDILEKIGLSKRESLIYLQLLKSSPLSPTDIANKTGIKRPNIYDTVTSLENKGLIHYQLKNKRRLIAASPPNSLLDISKQQFNMAKKILPLLLTLNKEQSFEPSISFYQGRKAMQGLFLEALNSKQKEIWALTSPRDLTKMLGEAFVRSFVKERLKKGIKVKSLRPAEKENKYEEQNNEYGREITEAAYVPPEYTFSLTLVIYDDCAIFHSSKNEGFGFKVESKELTEVMRMFYDNLWKNSGKLASP